MPYNPTLRAVLDFITETTDPYLNLFRRFLPPIGGGGFALDLSPIIGDHRAVRGAGDRRRPDRRVSADRPAPGAWPAPSARVVVAADQVAKAAIEAQPGARRARSTCSGRSSLTLAHNRGVAFGLAGGAGLPLILIAAGRAGAWSATSSPATRPGRGCGSRPGCWPGARSATSPTASRADAVTDYVDLASWPPFNLADVAIIARRRCCSSCSTCATPSGRRGVAEPELRIVHLDEALAVVDKPAGLVVHPAPSHRGPTLVDELARSSAAAATRSAPASSTGSTRRPAACSSSPAATRPTPPCRRRSSGARSNGSTWRWPAAGSARAPARSTPRSAAPRASATGWRSPAPASRQARTHFDGAGAAQPGELPGGAPGDRPHPPDPRPFRRDRPPAGRRPHLRRRRALRAASASSCTPTGSPSSTRSAASGSASSPSCRPTSPPRSTRPALA